MWACTSCVEYQRGCSALQVSYDMPHFIVYCTSSPTNHHSHSKRLQCVTGELWHATLHCVLYIQSHYSSLTFREAAVCYRWAKTCHTSLCIVHPVPLIITYIQRGFSCYRWTITCHTSLYHTYSLTNHPSSSKRLQCFTGELGHATLHCVWYI